MALRAKRSVGGGKFRSIVQILLLVLQVALVGLADADANGRSLFEAPSSLLQWPCEIQFEEDSFAEISIERANGIPNLKNLGLNLCNRIRGGKLGRRNNAVAQEEAEVESNGTEASPTTVVVKKRSEAPEIDYTKSPYAFSLYQDNDGSEKDPDGIPARYLSMQNNKRDKAQKALDATMQWREEKDINTILARPNPKFDVCKKVFPHFFCGRDDTNHVILLQRPGLIDLPMAQANGLTGQDLLHHYVHEMEYLWKILEPAADATMTSVLDLTGMNLSVLGKPELLNVVSLFCSTMDAHFPQRSHKTFLINAPRWFGAMFKIISPLLRESTKQKMSIFSKGKKQDEAIRELLSKQFASSGDDLQSVEDLPPNQMETDLRDFVLARLLESGTAMQPVIS